MLQAKKNEINVLAYWQIFLRRKYFFVIPFVLCLIIGIIWIILAKPVYESSVVVQISQTQLLAPSMRRLVPGVTEPERQEKGENWKNLITSYNYLMRLIKTLDLSNDPKMQKKANKERDDYPGLTLAEVTETLWHETLKSNINVKPLGTSYIRITSQGDSPELVYNITNMLSRIFIEESLEKEAGGINGAMNFSDEQLALYRQRLRESEERLQRFKENIVQEEFDENKVLPSNLDKINAMLSSVELDLQDAKDQLNYAENRINELGIFYYPPESEELNRLKSRLLEATLDLSKMMLKYSWDAPEVLRINLSIDELRGKIRSEIESKVKSQNIIEDGSNLDLVVQKITLPMDIEFLECKKTELNRLAKILKTNISSGPAREINLDRLENELRINKELFGTMLEQLTGTEIEKALQKTSAEFKFKIVEPATKPIKPIKPKRNRMFIMTLVFGIFLGFGMISMLEVADRSFRNVEEVEKYLILPVLGIIPPIDMEGGNKTGSKQNIGR